MNEAFYSVIVPVYNAEATLIESLDSVAKQSYHDFEVVIVNDGSEDDSLRLIEGWMERHAGIKSILVNQENLGLGAARNAGIRAASGRFVALLDADDLWHTDKLADCAQYLEKEPETVVLYHPVTNFGLDREYPRRVFPVEKADDLLIKGNPLVPSATILRRDLPRFQEDPRFHGAEDLFLWLELLARGHQLTYWPEGLTYYRETNGMSNRIEEHLNMVEEVYRHWHAQKLYSMWTLEKGLQRKYYEAARFWHKRAQHDRASLYYSAADGKSLKIMGLRFLNFLGLKA